jgi:glycosyltransferase involved in cell wall biosynthesis
MRILVNDFGGYPYPAELSRALAARGHEVLHTYCASLQTTPQGTLSRLPGDPETLEIRPLKLKVPLEKYHFVKRFFHEKAYGALAADALGAFRPDVVLSANTPLDAQQMLLRAARRKNARFVFWLQDVIGIAAERILREKVPVVGGLIGRHYVNLEARMLRQSDHTVVITDDFRPILHEWGVPDERITTVENWAPLQELPLASQEEGERWREANGLPARSAADGFLFVYAGTLALKHNPALLVRLADEVQGRARVVLLSQGHGADYLQGLKDEGRLQNLDILGFRPFAQMPAVFSATDVLAAVLEPEAGVFSVPSKVLAYLCGGKPLLTAMPPENLASRIVDGHDAGIVVAPDDADGFVRGGLALLRDAERRARMGRNARAYAEQTFDIEQITTAIEATLR